MTDKVLITSANSKRIDEAKAMLASVYLNAGWTGDYMLFHYGLKEKDVNWFKSRGVLTKECKPLLKKIGTSDGSLSMKLYLFKKEMRKWDYIVFLDSDIIVNSPINRITLTDGISAANDVDDQMLYDQFELKSKKNWDTLLEIETKFGIKLNLLHKSFNTGVLSINTKIIKNYTFDNLKNILMKSKNIIRYGDQGVMNMYFQNQRKQLPRVYNLHPILYIWDYKMRKKKIEAIILHFAGNNPGDKPWEKNSPYNAEWKKYKQKSDKINFKLSSKKPKSEWSKKKIIFTQFKLTLRKLFLSSPNKHHIIQKLFKIYFTKKLWSLQIKS